MNRLPCAECRKRNHLKANLRDLQRTVKRKDTEIFHLRGKLFETQDLVATLRHQLADSRKLK